LDSQERNEKEPLTRASHARRHKLASSASLQESRTHREYTEEASIPIFPQVIAAVKQSGAVNLSALAADFTSLTGDLFPVKCLAISTSAPDPP
jgi:hypothetical protein